MKTHKTIKQARKAAGVTQSHIARAIRMTQASVSRMERDNCCSSQEQAQLIADCLGQQFACEYEETRTRRRVFRPKK